MNKKIRKLKPYKSLYVLNKEKKRRVEEKRERQDEERTKMWLNHLGGVLENPSSSRPRITEIFRQYPMDSDIDCPGNSAREDQSGIRKICETLEKRYPKKNEEISEDGKE